MKRSREESSAEGDMARAEADPPLRVEPSAPANPPPLSAGGTSIPSHIYWRELGGIPRLGSSQAARQAFEKAVNRSRTITTSLAPLRVEGHEGCVNALAWKHDGEFLLSGSDDRTVKMWRVEAAALPHAEPSLRLTLPGHLSNVFAVDWVAGTGPERVLSAGNDSDIRLYDVSHDVIPCTVFQHHAKKVLKVATHAALPSCFMSCAADGTVRFIDLRQPYDGVRQESRLEYEGAEEDNYVLPQAFGGGRANRSSLFSTVSIPYAPRFAHMNAARDSLIVDYKIDSRASRRMRVAAATLFSMDIHPLDPHQFIVASAMGDVRLFDRRRLAATKDPGASCVSVYRNYSLAPPEAYEMTGCAFSHDGAQIVASTLNDRIYLFNTRENFEAERGIDLLRPPPPPEDGEDPMQVDPTFARTFSGHFSMATIKGVGFYGPTSDYVMSGSDDARVFLWDRHTGDIVNILEGHEQVVNVAVGHPALPLIASAGIDNYFCLWSPSGVQPTEELRQKQRRRWDAIFEENAENLRQGIDGDGDGPRGLPPGFEQFCAQQ